MSQIIQTVFQYSDKPIHLLCDDFLNRQNLSFSLFISYSIILGVGGRHELHSS